MQIDTNYCVDIDVNMPTLLVIRDQCRENIDNNASNWETVVRIAESIFNSYNDNIFRTIFYFKNEADAVMFKLRFG